MWVKSLISASLYTTRYDDAIIYLMQDIFIIICLLQKGRTPLHWASKGGHADIVCLLVSNGADINIKDNVSKFNTKLILDSTT